MVAVFQDHQHAVDCVLRLSCAGGETTCDAGNYDYIGSCSRGAHTQCVDLGLYLYNKLTGVSI
jgi:hypothetical protein